MPRRLKKDAVTKYKDGEKPTEKLISVFVGGEKIENMYCQIKRSLFYLITDMCNLITDKYILIIGNCFFIIDIFYLIKDI